MNTIAQAFQSQQYSITMNFYLLYMYSNSMQGYCIKERIFSTDHVCLYRVILFIVS